MTGGINTNLLAMVGLSAVRRAEGALHTALERLATGKRINRASDDPAGMVAAEGLDHERRVIERRLEGLEREEASLGAREGVHGVAAEMLMELNALVVRSANRGAMSEAEREAIQLEAEGIIEGIDFVYATASFGGRQLFTGLASTWLGSTTRMERVGGAGDESAGSGDPAVTEVQTQRRTYSLRDLIGAGAANLGTGDPELAQEIVRGALAGVEGQRGAIGSRLVEIDHLRGALGEQMVQLTDARSRIVDADFAVEAANLVRAQVMREVALRATRIALDSQRERALTLLRIPAAN